MISVEEALKTVLACVAPLELEQVGLLDAGGRVTGEDVCAGRAIPPGDQSTMDGYALRSADTRGSSPEKPAVLHVVEDIPAGKIPVTRIEAGQAARIMTGATLPEGADAVVRLEDARREGGRVAVLAAARRGQDIRCAGEDVQTGEKVIARGDLIRPAEVGMLAALGRPSIGVHRRPRVAIVATGDELTEVDAPPSAGKIVGSNSYLLAALVRECGGVPLQLGIAGDRREDLLAKFREAIQSDLILSSGGVSAGDYDLVKEIMKEPGNRLLFWQVAMKPGRSFAFGSLGPIPMAGLPGGPAAAAVCFEQFIRPAILKMTGHANLFRRTVRARLEEGIVKKEGVRHFVRARICHEGKGHAAVATAGKGSGPLTSMVRANGLIILPEHATVVRKGMKVTVQLLDDSLERMPQPGY